MSSLLESVFEFFFKYRPLVFAKSTFAFAASSSATSLVAVALLAAIPISLTYLWVRAESQRRDRFWLATSRVFLLALLGFCLLRPSLSISTLVPQRGYVAVLIDDSRSMRVRDHGDAARSDAVRAWFGEHAELRRRLEEKFRVRYYGFGGDARLANVDSLAFSAGLTDIGRALDHVTNDMTGHALSAIVLVSDGADNSQTDLAEPLLALRAAGVPVFPVAVGAADVSNDVQVSRVALPASVLKDATVLADVELRHSGFGGQRVRVEIEDSGRLLAREEIELPRAAEHTSARIAFTATETGPRTLKVRVSPPAGERITQNNEREALLIVRGGREKILYVEGEPRFEMKFARRALAAETNLQLVVLQRTANEKFLRLDVDSAAELSGGFPTTRAELFRYRALILGSIEASFFTHDQLELIEEFVSRRGGGLLVLGGPDAFAEGGWTGTPVASALPVELEAAQSAERKFVQTRATPTHAGVLHPVTLLAQKPADAEKRWRTLPEISLANQVTRVKPGATTLLVGDAAAGNAVLLAHQRYGRGSVIAFTPQDSWLWQMHADVPVDDLTHETFWRQMLRWLVQGAGEPVRVNAPPIAAAGQPVTIVAQVEDSGFVGINDATVVAEVTAPDGSVQEVPAAWSGAGDGEFGASFTPQRAGVHDVRVTASRNGRTLGAALAHVQSSAADAEFFDPQMRESTLRRVASETGGRVYSRASAATLPDDISVLGRGETLTELKDLWDMPIVFLLLIALATVEWLVRRRKGLV